MKTPPTIWMRCCAALLTAATALLLNLACGGGGTASSSSTSATSSTSSEKSDLVISLTDGEGDFLSYTVDVAAITLKKANGTIVEALPASTRVDFAQYTDLTEFFTAASIPLGAYTSMVLRLDFTSADIQVEVNGEAKKVDVRDAKGRSAGVMDVTVNLSNAQKFVVAPGLTSHLALDFDLAASNQLDTTSATPVIKVSPNITAEIDPVRLKETRIRGLLKDVSAASSSFTINVRPFNRRDGDFGNFSVKTDAETEWEIDGSAYKGSTGIEKLATLPAGTMVGAFGELKLATRSFLASRVHAGSSVPGSTKDFVRGSVLARNGSLLTVRGASLSRGGQELAFYRDNVIVDVASVLVVRRMLDPQGTYTTDDIRPGSFIGAAGTLSTDAGSTTTFTATQARLDVSFAAGLVVQVGTGSFTLDTKAVNGRPVALYSLSNPAALLVSTGSLSLKTLKTGDIVRVRGFFSATGMTAVSLANLTSEEAGVMVSWTATGSATGLSTVSSNSIVVNLADSRLGDMHYVKRAGIVMNLLAMPNPTSLSIAAPASDTGSFSIVMESSVRVFTKFSDFASELALLYPATGKVKLLVVTGTFDASSNRVTATTVRVLLL